MGDFPAAFLTAPDPAAELPERLDKEALHVMRLQPLRFGSLHLDAQIVNPCPGQGIVCQRPALEEPQKTVPVDGPVHGIEEPGLDVLLLAIADRLKSSSLRGVPSNSSPRTS